MSGLQVHTNAGGATTAGGGASGAPEPAGVVLQDWQVRLVLPHRPPVLQLDTVTHLAPTLDALEAQKALGGSDPMLHRRGDGPARLAPGAIVEGLAQCCGLLLRLRWLAAQGVDLAAFAAGDARPLQGLDIPRSLLAESHARFVSAVPPGRLVRLRTRLVLSRGDMHRFRTSAESHGELASVDITLSFPQTH